MGAGSGVSVSKRLRYSGCHLPCWYPKAQGDFPQPAAVSQTWKQPLAGCQLSPLSACLPSHARLVPSIPGPPSVSVTSSSGVLRWRAVREEPPDHTFARSSISVGSFLPSRSCPGFSSSVLILAVGALDSCSAVGCPGGDGVTLGPWRHLLSLQSLAPKQRLLSGFKL